MGWRALAQSFCTLSAVSSPERVVKSMQVTAFNKFAILCSLPESPSATKFSRCFVIALWLNISF